LIPKASAIYTFSLVVLTFSFEEKEDRETRPGHESKKDREKNVLVTSMRQNGVSHGFWERTLRGSFSFSVTDNFLSHL